MKRLITFHEHDCLVVGGGLDLCRPRPERPAGGVAGAVGGLGRDHLVVLVVEWEEADGHSGARWRARRHWKRRGDEE